jgi:hypothetical protein
MRLLGIGGQYVQIELSESDLVFLAEGLDGDEEYSAFAVAFRSLAGLAALRGDVPVDGDKGVVDMMGSVGLPDGWWKGVGGAAAGSP